LGSFVNTLGNRILFFPSSTLSRIIHTPDGRDLTNQELHNIEHFTIQTGNLTSWHITTLQKRTLGVRYPTLKTKKVNEHAFLWFLMAVRDATKLEVLPKSQEYQLKGPHTDMKRRFENMVKSVEGRVFPVTLVNFNTELSSFINFEVFISNKNGELDPPRDVFVIPSTIAKSIGGIQKIGSRVHDFSLGDSISISIRVYKIMGTIKYDTVFLPGDFP
jgi:hypothetical protein